MLFKMIQRQILMLARILPMQMNKIKRDGSKPNGVWKNHKPRNDGPSEWAHSVESSPINTNTNTGEHNMEIDFVMKRSNSNEQQFKIAIP